MFNIAATRHFTRKITLATGEDFTARFIVLPDDEIAAHALDSREGEDAFLTAVVTGLDGVTGEEGEAIPYSRDLLTQMLGFSDIRLGLLKAYREGRAEVRTGN